MIPEHLYGQFIIMKKNTGAILIFKESGGEQKRATDITNKNKQLQFQLLSENSNNYNYNYNHINFFGHNYNYYSGTAVETAKTKTSKKF